MNSGMGGLKAQEALSFVLLLPGLSRATCPGSDPPTRPPLMTRLFRGEGLMRQFLRGKITAGAVLSSFPYFEKSLLGTAFHEDFLTLEGGWELFGSRMNIV